MNIDFIFFSSSFLFYKVKSCLKIPKNMFSRGQYPHQSALLEKSGICGTIAAGSSLPWRSSALPPRKTPEHARCRVARVVPANRHCSSATRPTARRSALVDEVGPCLMSPSLITSRNSLTPPPATQSLCTSLRNSQRHPAQTSVTTPQPCRTH